MELYSNGLISQHSLLKHCDNMAEASLVPKVTTLKVDIFDTNRKLRCFNTSVDHFP